SIPLLAAIVGSAWALIALLIHRVVVPRIAGPDGTRLGKFEAEVASQLGIVLGLLLSFNAVTVWEQSSAARDATLAEASALREITDLLPEISPDRQAQLRDALRAYLAHVIDVEWPQLGRGSLGLQKPAALRSLAHLGRASGNQDIHDAVGAAVSGREQRIRIATNRMLPARWSIVVVLGALALLAIGLVHAENRRARAVAIAMVTFAIASCFLVLMVQVRPFLGVLALQPTELKSLAGELGSAPH
ncbi:MAG: hypothetical protein ACRERC_03200, partial [Candidatus Binatia bacterium]